MRSAYRLSGNSTVNSRVPAVTMEPAEEAPVQSLPTPHPTL